MRNRWMTLTALLLAAILGGFSLSAASATDPGPLTDRITDHSDVVTAADRAAADATLEKLRAETGIDLFFVLVPDYTAPEAMEDWTTATAEGNGFRENQYLISVATQGRTYTMFRPYGARMSESERDEILSAMRPDLSRSDFSSAIVAGADKAYDIYVLAPQRAAQGGLIFGIILVLIALAVVVFFVIRAARRRAAEAAKRRAQIEAVAQEANIALVRTDDLVRSSEQELEYARAQFGDEVIGEFVTALQTSRSNLDEAFALKQKLDDAIPDSDADRLAWNERVLQLCSDSTQVLEERKADFDALRRLEQDAPAALENVRRIRDAAGAEVNRAEQILAALSSAYAQSAVASVADNPAQARSRLAFTDAQIRTADQAIAAGETGQAAVAVRAAEGAVQQATQLEDAVEQLQHGLSEADERAAALIAELESDIQTARSLPDTQGAVAQAISATQDGIGRAQALLGAGGRNPVEALRVLDAANSTIDAVIQQVRDEQARIQHAVSRLGAALQRAAIQLSSAEAFILNRRGAILATARTRLAEARSSLDQAHALAASDPVQALGLAQRADTLATEALRMAENDYGSWNGGGGGRGDDALGAFLGGILIGQSGNHHHGGGWGGGGGGIFGGGGGGGFGGGGSSGGGGFFGGGGGGGGFSVGGFGGGGGGGGSSGGGGHF